MSTQAVVRSQATFCRICEAACGLRVDVTADGQPVRIQPDRTHPMSHGFACAKGTRFVEVARHPERLLSPMRRTRNGYEHISWQEAMRDVAQRLRPLIARHGPHTVGVYFGNPLAFHTLGALTMMVFLRALGTRNVFTAGSQDCNNKFAGAQIVHGSPVIHPIPDFAHTDCAVLFGTNPAVSQGSFVHLQGGSTVFDRLVRRHGHIVWVDPRYTESAQRWGEHMPIRPGTDVFLFLALLHELRDRHRTARHVEGLEALLAVAAVYPAERAAHLTGIDPTRIRQLAARLRTASSTALHMSVGVNQGAFGTLCYVALQALAYLSGNFDRQGGLLFHPFAVHLSNLMRAFGLANNAAHSRIGHFPSVLTSLPAGILADEILTDGPEQIRALLVVGGDPLVSVPGATRLQQAFQRLEFLMCADLFVNTTGQQADLLLPTTSWLERWDIATTTALFQQGPFVQYTPPVCSPPAEVRSETRILADLSLAIGRPLFGSTTLTHLCSRLPWDALLTTLCDTTLWPMRLLHGGVRGIPTATPRPGSYLGYGPRTPGHRVRFWHPTLAGEPGRLADYAAALEGNCLSLTTSCDSQAGQPSPETLQDFQFSLLCRRRRLGHNSWIHGAGRDGNAEAAAWLAPADLARLGLVNGAEVLLSTVSATLRVPVVAVPEVACGTIVVPHGIAEMNVNALIPSGPDRLEPLSGQHFMTGIPVRITPA